jgi:Ca2+-binding RTX toxin-like protein
MRWFANHVARFLQVCVNGGGGRKNRQAVRRSARSARRRPIAPEQLEQRLLLTHSEGSPFQDAAGILNAELGDMADVLVVGPGTAPSTVELTINGDVHSYDQNSVRGLRVWAAGGDDRVEVSPLLGIAASLFGGDGNDTLIGGYGADQLDGGAGTDSLVGDDGDDLFRAEPGDTIDGGPGIDSVELTVAGSDADDAIRIENLDDLTTRLTINGQPYDFVRYELTLVSIDAGLGNDLVELMSDVAVPATVLGGAGSDTLRGGAGADLLDGGDGADSISGGDGNDILLAEPADTVSGDAGDDAILLRVAGTDAADVIQLAYLDDLTTRVTINGVSYD